MAMFENNATVRKPAGGKSSARIRLGKLEGNEAMQM